MTQKNVITIAIPVLAILIAFSWIGYAYIMGTEADKMLLHPIVPILLIPLLFSFRRLASMKSIATVAIVLISIWLFARLQGVFMPFVIGFSLAYVVNVSISGLQNIPLPKGRRLRLSRGTAIAIIVVLIIGIITFLAFGIVPQIVEQAVAMEQGIIYFYNTVKDYVVNLAVDLENGEYPFKDRLPESWQTAVGDFIDRMNVYIQEKIPSLARSASEIIGELLLRLSSGLVGGVGRISSAFFILIVFIYAIQSFRTHVEKIGNIFPEDQRRLITRYIREIDEDMRAFLKGQLAVVIIISIISTIAYSIIRVPFALLVGSLAGLCNAIPTIGPFIGGGIAILASITGFVAGNYGLAGFLIQLALVVGVVFGIQILDNSLISPKIMSSAVEVHPLVVMFAVLLSASLIGIWGAVLAIPGVVVVKGIIKVSGEIRAEQRTSNP